MAQSLIDVDDIDCYLYYVEDLLDNKEEIIGEEVMQQVMWFGDRFYDIAMLLKQEKEKRSKT